MKIFLSALENGAQCKQKDADGKAKKLTYYFKEKGLKYKWNLMSYYYISKNQYDVAEQIRDNSELILIDSGAHSFQFGVKVNWVEYTKQYAEFIKKFDKPNVIGYFKMDIENIIGYDKVLELRKILEAVSDKIIPVWHPDRGINDYIEMCKKYHDKIIAIGGFRGTDIKDEQFIMFLKTAKKYNCKVHCLGMTRKKVLDKVPFDFTDSSSWKQHALFGEIKGKGKVSKQFSKERREDVFLESYKQAIKMQKHYYNKWKKICKD